MEQVISKQELDTFKKINGEVKGIAFKENMDFVLKEEGEEGLKKLEKVLADLDCPLKNDDIKSMKFYPLWWDAVLLTAIKRLFNYSDDRFEQMGRFEPKSSFIIRIFMKYFVSIEKAAKEVSRLWRQTYTVGDLKVVEYNQEKRVGIIRLENYSLIPVQSFTLKGYFASVLQLIVGKTVTCDMTKSPFAGDKYYEFSMRW